MRCVLRFFSGDGRDPGSDDEIFLVVMLLREKRDHLFRAGRLSEREAWPAKQRRRGGREREETGLGAKATCTRNSREARAFLVAERWNAEKRQDPWIQKVLARVGVKIDRLILDPRSRLRRWFLSSDQG
jgi:hypothetical protein